MSVSFVHLCLWDTHSTLLLVEHANRKAAAKPIDLGMEIPICLGTLSWAPVAMQEEPLCLEVMVTYNIP